MTEEKKQYTISYLVKTESGKEAVLNSLNKVSVQNLVEGRFTELKLAYPIKKQTSAFFGSMAFKASPETIIKIDEQFKFIEDILRFLIIATPVRKTNSRFANNQRVKENIGDTNNINNVGAINSTVLVTEKENLVLEEEAEEAILKQADELLSVEEPTNNDSFKEEHSFVKNGIDDTAFDEKLKEILTDSQAK